MSKVVALATALPVEPERLESSPLVPLSGERIATPAANAERQPPPAPAYVPDPPVSRARPRAVAMARAVILPGAVFLLVLAVWMLVNAKITSDIPTPAATWARAVEIFGQPFYVAGPNDMGIGWQVLYSLGRVLAGFALAVAVGIPVGFLMGASRDVHQACYPLVQILRPVSPLAWLPIVTMVVSASVSSDDPTLPKSFVISAVVVMLCSLWPTLINTAIGTASIDKDLIAVGRVLRLGWFAKLTRLVLPSSLPYIFTGMRLSLGTGWMVLIAAEMLAQNPGLGKFVWDEFQNGSEKSLARIMVAVVVIGLIGFGLDRVMMALQSFVSRNRTV